MEKGEAAVFVFIVLMVVHMLPWHRGDMVAVPGEDRVTDTLRQLHIAPGE